MRYFKSTIESLGKWLAWAISFCSASVFASTVALAMAAAAPSTESLSSESEAEPAAGASAVPVPDAACSPSPVTLATVGMVSSVRAEAPM